MSCSVTDNDSDGYSDDLSCSISTLLDGGSFSLSVATAAAVTATDCDFTFNNEAFADADNADQVSDTGSITVECGAIAVDKFAKDATTPNDPDFVDPATVDVDGLGPGTYLCTIVIDP